MKTDPPKRRFLRFPVINLGAEYLVQGYLMRRNIQTYKAPSPNEGYDLICTHPDPQVKRRPVRVQVKSRCQTGCPLEFPLQTKSLGAFDFVVVVLMNVGRFGKAAAVPPPENLGPIFYTFPAKFIRQHHDASPSWPKVRLRGMSLDRYKNDRGFERIARCLGIPYPSRAPSAGPPKVSGRGRGHRPGGVL